MVVRKIKILKIKVRFKSVSMNKSFFVLFVILKRFVQRYYEI